MSTVEEGLKAQVRNIEATYGRPISAWIDLVRESGKTKHGELVTWLKTEHGMTHGSANRVALIAREALSEGSSNTNPEDQLYSGKKAAVRPIHTAVMATISGFGDDVEVAPKKGYLSVRRRKQFAMLQPGAAHLDVGLILKGTPPTDRLQSASTFNAMFTHRVRVDSIGDLDPELTAWLREAYDRAG